MPFSLAGFGVSGAKGAAMGPWGVALAIAESFAENMILSAIMAKLFPTAGPANNDRHIVGIDDGTSLDLIFNEWRCDTGVIYGEDLRVYTSTGKVSVVFAGNCGFAPLIVPGGDPALLKKVWFGTINGSTKKHYDSSRAKNFDPPFAVYGANQVTADPYMSGKAAALTPPIFVPAYSNQLIVLWKQLHTVDYGNQVPSAQSYLWQAGTGDLADIVSALISLRGIDLAYIDVTDLVGIQVTGCKCSTPQSVGQFIEMLCNFYAVNIFPSGGKIKFRQRRSDSIDGTFDFGDLGAGRMDSASTESRVSIVESQAYEQDVPGTVHIDYRKSDDDHQPAMEPVVLDESLGTEYEKVDVTWNAATQAEVIAFGKRYLDEKRKSRRVFEFTLPPTYWGVELCDVWDLPLDSASIEVVRVRINQISEQDPLGNFRVTAYEVSSQPINTTATGTGGGTSTDGGGEIADITGVVWSPGVDTGEPEPYPSDPDALQPSVIIIPSWPSGFNDSGGEAWVRVHGSGSAWTRRTEFLLPGLIGETVSVMPDATTALDFETRLTDIILAYEFDTDGDLADTTEAEITDGIKTGEITSNICLIEQEIAAFTTQVRTGIGAYRTTGWYGGINSTPYTGHTSPARFARIPSLADLIRLTFDQSSVGTQVDIALIAPGDTITTFYTVTIGRPGVGGADAALVHVNEYNWDDDGTQRPEAWATWGADTDNSKQNPAGRWSVSGNNGSTWSIQDRSVIGETSLTSGTYKFRFEPVLPDNTLGTAIYSANKSYRTPPAGSGGSGSSSRGSRLVFNEISAPAGNTITATVETAFASVYTMPAGLPVAGQAYVLNVSGNWSGMDDFTLRLKANGTVVAITDDPVNFTEPSLTNFALTIPVVILADGAGGSVIASNILATAKGNGDTKPFQMSGTATGIDFSVPVDWELTLECSFGGLSMTADVFKWFLEDIVGSGVDESVLDDRYYTRDGSGGALTDDLLGGGFEATGFVNATADDSLTTLAQLYESPAKEPARVLATTNQSLTGPATIDGVVLGNNNVVLLQGQTAPEENGSWRLKTAGAWVRTEDSDTADKLARNPEWLIIQGTYAGRKFYVSSSTAGLVLGTTAIVISEIQYALTASIPTLPSFADNEIPAGTVDGANLSFSLAHSPSPAGSLILVSDGMTVVATQDFTLSTNAITFVGTHQTPKRNLRAWYRY